MQLAEIIWQLFWGDLIRGCLQAIVAFVCEWPQWSALLCSASIPAAAAATTQEPPLHNHSTANHHPQYETTTTLSAFTPSKGKVTRQIAYIHAPTSAEKLEGILAWLQRATMCYSSPLLSLSRDEFISQSTAQNKGRGGCSDWNSTREEKKRAYRRKSD